MQDVNGWKSLQEKLGKKCLLIAENALSKGLPLKSPPPTSASGGKSEVDSESTPVSPGGKVEAINQSGNEKREVGESESSTSEEKEPGVEYLSCAGVKLETTVWSTIQKAAALKG